MNEYVLNYYFNIKIILTDYFYQINSVESEFLVSVEKGGGDG
jgi:hypothetical protein